MCLTDKCTPGAGVWLLRQSRFALNVSTIYNGENEAFSTKGFIIVTAQGRCRSVASSAAVLAALVFLRVSTTARETLLNFSELVQRLGSVTKLLTGVEG